MREKQGDGKETALAMRLGSLSHNPDCGGVYRQTEERQVKRIKARITHPLLHRLHPLPKAAPPSLAL
jgi:hypothetical protein